MSEITDWYRVRLFYASNTKGGKTWFWDDIMNPFKDDALLNWIIGGSVRIWPQKLQDMLNLSKRGLLSLFL